MPFPPFQPAVLSRRLSRPMGAQQHVSVVQRWSRIPDSGSPLPSSVIIVIHDPGSAFILVTSLIDHHCSSVAHQRREVAVWEGGIHTLTRSLSISSPPLPSPISLWD